MNPQTIAINGLELPLALTVAQSMPLTTLGRDATYAAVERGEIPSLRVGRRLLIPTIPLLRALGAIDELPGQSPPTEVTAPEGTATKVESTGQMEPQPKLSIARPEADRHDQNGAA